VFVLIVWGAVYTLALGLSKGPVFEWYLAPTLLAYLFAIGAGTGWIIFMITSHIPIPARMMPILGIVIAIVFSFANLIIAYTKTGKEYQRDLQVRQNIGEWLRQQSHAPASVMLEPIGYIGYYSGLKVLDVIGLINPEAIDYLVKYGSKDYVAVWALEVMPEFVIVKPEEFNKSSDAISARFLDSYELRMRVADSTNEMTYWVFQRK
jgi:hypothetical protein